MQLHVVRLLCPTSNLCDHTEHKAFWVSPWQANDLISKLKEDGMDFEEDLYFTAGYDAPFK